MYYKISYSIWGKVVKRPTSIKGTFGAYILTRWISKYISHVLSNTARVWEPFGFVHLEIRMRILVWRSRVVSWPRGSAIFISMSCHYQSIVDTINRSWYNPLSIHWDRDKISAIFQTTFWYGLCVLACSNILVVGCRRMATPQVYRWP